MAVQGGLFTAIVLAIILLIIIFGFSCYWCRNSCRYGAYRGASRGADSTSPRRDRLWPEGSESKDKTTTDEDTSLKLPTFEQILKKEEKSDQSLGLQRLKFAER